MISDLKPSQTGTVQVQSAQTLHAALEHVLGITPSLMLTDRTGRPLPLLDDRAKIEALVYQFLAQTL